MLKANVEVLRESTSLCKAQTARVLYRFVTSTQCTPFVVMPVRHREKERKGAKAEIKKCMCVHKCVKIKSQVGPDFACFPPPYPPNQKCMSN